MARMIMPLHIQALHCWAPQADGVASWLAWRDGKAKPAGAEPPPLKDIKPMQRRRLSLAARAAFAAAGACLQAVPEAERTNLACVFASAHGQCNASLKMLETLARHEQLSPAAFSLSVHNAIAGQFSISHGLTGVSVSMAPGRDGLGGVLMEACGILQDDTANRVLVCCVEEPVPEELKPYEENPPTPLAAAILLSGEATAGCVRLHMQRNPSDGAAPLPFWQQVREFVCFAGQGQGLLTLAAGPAQYAWQRDALG